MDELPESTQINRFASDLRPLNIKLARFHRMVRQCQRVQHARLPGTVRAIEQRDRPQGDTLGRAERLEVGDAEGPENHDEVSEPANVWCVSA